MPRLLALLLLLAAAWLPNSSVELVAAVLVVSIAVLLIWQPAPDRSIPLVWVRSSRLLARRLAFLPSRDPDADGRVRPRAPGQRPAAI